MPFESVMHEYPYLPPQHLDATQSVEGKGSQWPVHVVPWVLLYIAPLLLQLTDTLLPNRQLPLGEWPEPSWIDHLVTGLIWLQVPMALLSIVLAWRKMPGGTVRWLVIGVAVASIPAMLLFGLGVLMDKTGKWL